MPIELVDAPAGDYKLARFFAKAVDYAYLNDPAGAEKFRDELGMEAHLISVGNTQVYVAHNDKHIVVAFRGSESPTSFDGFKDWLLTNANNLLVLPEGQAGTDFAAAGVGARFHRGFIEALHSVWEPFVGAVDAAYSAKERPIWVCGHSLGGALALLAAWRLERNALPVHQVYTFGAPMIGNAAAAAAIEQQFSGRIFRVINGGDLVPKLPTISLTSNAYEHCQREVPLGKSSVSIPTDLAAGEQIDDAAKPGIWTFIMGNIEAHFMNNYLRQLDEQCGE
jgi:triacylglycerol lipase